MKYKNRKNDTVILYLQLKKRYKNTEKKICFDKEDFVFEWSIEKSSITFAFATTMCQINGKRGMRRVIISEGLGK